LPTSNEWRARRQELEKLSIFDDFAQLEASRSSRGVTLGIVRPIRVAGLDITPVKNSDWTPEERQKLVQLQGQGGLFDTTDAKAVATLRKLPFDFHYRYECRSAAGTHEYRHKIVDWEAGALFWNVWRRHGDGWQAPFRHKMENDLPSKDLMFLMGTIHRFPDQWLIVSLIYPPKVSATRPKQASLFD
jgi:hypothetical protein